MVNLLPMSDPDPAKDPAIEEAIRYKRGRRPLDKTLITSPDPPDNLVHNLDPDPYGLNPPPKPAPKRPDELTLDSIVENARAEEADRLKSNTTDEWLGLLGGSGPPSQPKLTNEELAANLQQYLPKKMPPPPKNSKQEPVAGVAPKSTALAKEKAMRSSSLSTEPNNAEGSAGRGLGHLLGDIPFGQYLRWLFVPEGKGMRQGWLTYLLALVAVSWFFYDRGSHSAADEVSKLNTALGTDQATISSLTAQIADLNVKYETIQFERDRSVLALKKHAIDLSNEIMKFHNEWALSHGIKLENGTDLPSSAMTMESLMADLRDETLEYRTRFSGRVTAIRDQLSILGIESKRLDAEIAYLDNNYSDHVGKLARELRALAEQIKE